jgi:hypothetical protein
LISLAGEFDDPGKNRYNNNRQDGERKVTFYEWDIAKKIAGKNNIIDVFFEEKL